jgi:TonB-dependent receptor
MRTTAKTLLLCSCAALWGGRAWAADAAAAASISEIVVTAPRQEVEARVEQREAPNLVTVQSAESIAKYPDFNAAESLGRLPGISLSSDTGEGRFINIRGIDGNLDGATFGGVPLLNTNPGGTYFSGGGRAVEFDTIPVGSIDGLIVTYTGLPDHEAEGLGGSVEMTPRTAATINRPFIDVAAGWGYEPAHNHDGPLNLDLAAGMRFGFNGGRMVVQGRDADTGVRSGWVSNATPFSVVVTGSLRNDRRGFDDIEEDYNAPGSKDRSYQDIQLRHYDYHRSRFGGGGEFDFRPNDNHHWYLRANVAGYTEAVKKNRLTYDFSAYDQTAAGAGFRTQADLNIAPTDERETHRNDIYVLGGKDTFGKTVLDYRVSYSSASFDVDQNYNAKFVGPTGVPFAYDNSGKNGDFPRLKILDATDPNNAALYAISGKGKVTNSQEHDLDRETAYAANLLTPVHLLSDGDNIKVGVEVRLRDKSQNQYRETLSIGTSSMTPFASGAFTDFYGARYTNGANVNTLALRAKAQAIEGPNRFNPSGYFNAREDLYSGYAQYEGTAGPWGVLAGARVEATDAAYGNYVFDGNGANLGFVTTPRRYTNVFPTVQLRYTVSPQFLVRATYSTGVGRPGFNQVAGAATVDVDNGVISSGNPKLRPIYGDNFDLAAEYYLPAGGIVQFGLFYKTFGDYIVARQTTGTDPRIPGNPAVKFVTYDNVADAYARGVQAAYHHQFSGLPAPFDGLGLDANAAFVDSRIQEYDAKTSAIGVAEYGALPGTARYTANLAGFYEAHRVMIRLSAQFVGHKLFTLGGTKANDVTEDDRTTLDLATAYHFTPAWSVYFNAKNLTNAPLRFYIGNPSFPIQREFYDVTYEAGVKFHF